MTDTNEESPVRFLPLKLFKGLESLHLMKKYRVCFQWIENKLLEELLAYWFVDCRVRIRIAAPEYLLRRGSKQSETS